MLANAKFNVSKTKVVKKGMSNGGKKGGIGQSSGRPMTHRGSPMNSFSANGTINLTNLNKRAPSARLSRFQRLTSNKDLYKGIGS
jgi:hypothetical protein